MPTTFWALQYTLASYTDALPHTIYQLAKEVLTDKLRYPADIKDLAFDPHFAIRGLHYDTLTGLILKMDGFHRISLDTVYRGFEYVPPEETLAVFNGRHVPLEYMNEFYGRGGRLHQLTDVFSMPEVCTDLFMNLDPVSKCDALWLVLTSCLHLSVLAIRCVFWRT